MISFVRVGVLVAVLVLGAGCTSDFEVDDPPPTVSIVSTLRPTMAASPSGGVLMMPGPRPGELARVVLSHGKTSDSRTITINDLSHVELALTVKCWAEFDSSMVNYSLLVDNKMVAGGGFSCGDSDNVDHADLPPLAAGKHVITLTISTRHLITAGYVILLPKAAAFDEASSSTTVG